jgi:hypothetical protein
MSAKPHRSLWNKMLSRVATVAFGASALSGCAMCCGPFDYHYPTYGGRVQRADPEYGRVGSIFSDAYTAGSGPSADSNVVVPKLSNPNNTTSTESESWSAELEPAPHSQADQRGPVEQRSQTEQPTQRKSLDEWRNRSTPTNWR